MQCVNNPKNNETISKILEEMNYAEQFLLNWKAYWYEKKEILIPIKSVDVDNKYEICTIEWNGITTNKCSRRITFNSDGNITLKKDKQKFSKRKLDYSIKYNLVNDDFDIELAEVLKEKEGIYPKLNCSTIYLEKKGVLLTKTTQNIEFRYNLLNGEKSVYIYTKKSSGKVNGIYKLDIKDNEISKITFYSRKGNKQELTNDYNCKQLILLLKFLGVNVLLDMEIFNKLENKIDSLVKEIVPELPIKGLYESINNNYKINIKQQCLTRK